MSQEYLWVPTAGPVAVLPAPDPAVLAQRAIGELVVPVPGVHWGPDSARVAVKIPVWLWVDDAGPVSVTVSLRGVSVTATATLSSVSWSMGEPAANPDTNRGAALAAPVVCSGAGVAPVRGQVAGVVPECGYTYRWRSTKERTFGVGAWPVSVTAAWSVVWTSNTGVSGTVALLSRADTAISVGEWRVELVTGR